MEKKDIRWQQRFKNFESAFNRFKEALAKEDLSELERNGLVKRFEFTIEMGWKTMKDFLEEEGFTVNSPKGTFRQAFESGYLKDAQPLIDALEVRNKLSHDYDGEYFEEAEPEIRDKIFPGLETLYKFFVNQGAKAQGKLFDGESPK